MADEIVAVFSDPDAAARALGALQASAVAGVQVASPAPFPIVHLTGQPGPWRWLGPVALFGGLTGLSTATALEVITSKSLNMIVGGKPIVSWPAFAVVMFELTMLFAGAANFTALIVLSALARRRMPRAAREQVNSERIVVFVPGGGDGQRAAALKSLDEASAVLP
jgi:hypothetical protein